MGVGSLNRAGPFPLIAHCAYFAMSFGLLTKVSPLKKSATILMPSRPKKALLSVRRPFAYKKLVSGNRSPGPLHTIENSLSFARTRYLESGYAALTTSWMALTMSASMINGLGEHPKQAYSVGKNFDDQVAWVNSGKLERSEAEVTSNISRVVLAALGVFPGWAVAFDAFCCLSSSAGDLRMTLGGLTRA
jgi:hypothetical protein